MKRFALRLLSILAPCSLAFLVGAAPASAQESAPGAGLVFRVTADPAALPEPASGRLMVFLIQEGTNIQRYTQPIDGPFYFSPQPLFAIDVKDFRAGETVEIGDQAASFPCKPSALPAGIYKVQAVFDRVEQSGKWRRESGNLHSKMGQFTLMPGRAPAPVELKLAEVVQLDTTPNFRGAPIEYVEVRSELLSKFHGRDIVLNAAVLPPIGYDPSRRYPAVYEVPGFGGTHLQIAGAGIARMKNNLAPDSVDLQSRAFLIGLNPDSPNGHTLFADSDNNGPWSEALVNELIPELEKRYPLIASPAGRVVRGHSSGGWSAVWLTLQHPEVFGAAWAGAPDPVDFRAFQRTNIYSDPSFYTGPDGKDTPSTINNGRVSGTVRQENQYEEALGPDNTSGEQWDSWQAVFGPRGPRGTPAALFDPGTGAVDRTIAESYRKYDIAELVRKDPKRFGPIFQQRIRILVGDEDDWNLNEACALLKKELADAGYPLDGSQGPGAITIIRHAGHSSVLQSPEARARDAEIVKLFRALDAPAAAGH